MYDRTGLPEGGTQSIIDDWKLLIDRMRIGTDERDPAYVHHDRKPVVAAWGIGFNDGRKYNLAERERLIEVLKSDPKYGGFTGMVRIPTPWRTFDTSSRSERAPHRAIRQAHIHRPPTLGRDGQHA